MYLRCVNYYFSLHLKTCNHVYTRSWLTLAWHFGQDTPEAIRKRLVAVFISNATNKDLLKSSPQTKNNSQANQSLICLPKSFKHLKKPTFPKPLPPSPMLYLKKKKQPSIASFSTRFHHSTPRSPREEKVAGVPPGAASPSRWASERRPRPSPVKSPARPRDCGFFWWKGTPCSCRFGPGKSQVCFKKGKGAKETIFLTFAAGIPHIWC